MRVSLIRPRLLPTEILLLAAVPPTDLEIETTRIIHAGRAKRLFSKTAGSEEANRTLAHTVSL